ncbi:MULTISPECIES: STAS domain-containing protein [Bacillus]|uniref:STAS domain-containing protein n=1 Tax=Bacillus TaxID=1386 RepID=UPI000BB77883|nr:MULTISPECIES: STAS domain-containing protein [Bacillus]
MMNFSITNTFETKRRQMIKEINSIELTSEKAITMSQELDVYINLLQRRYPHQSFQVWCFEQSSHIKASLKGHLDYSSTDQVETFLSSFSKRFSGFESLEIDLSQLTFIDSSGARLLYELIVTAHEIGIQTTISEAKGIVYELLDIMGFFHLVQHI